MKKDTDSISQTGYAEIVLIYHSIDEDTKTTIYYMNDKGVTIDRVDF